MISRQIPKKKFFEVGQLHVAVGSILYKLLKMGFWAKICKMLPIATLSFPNSKKFFLGICLLIII